MKHLKVIQIAVMDGDADTPLSLFVLCDDGSIWWGDRTGGEWSWDLVPGPGSRSD
jgi:hypothetical protein